MYAATGKAAPGSAPEKSKAAPEKTKTAAEKTKAAPEYGVLMALGYLQEELVAALES